MRAYREATSSCATPAPVCTACASVDGCTRGRRPPWFSWTEGSMSDVVALRPLGVGDILDEAFRLYRRNFGYLVGISLAALGPAALATVVLGALGAMAGGAAGVAIGAGIGGILIALAGLI